MSTTVSPSRSTAIDAPSSSASRCSASASRTPENRSSQLPWTSAIDPPPGSGPGDRPLAIRPRRQGRDNEATDSGMFKHLTRVAGRTTPRHGGTDMARISVFGGTGYAGSNIIAEAVKRGHTVTSVSRNLPEQRVDGVEYVTGSLLDSDTRARALADADVVVVAVAPRGDMAGQVHPGITALAAEAERAGVRIGVIGGAGSLHVAEGGPRLFDTPDFPAAYRPESVEMAAALDDLRSSPESLDWFYVCPPAGFGGFAPG